MTTPITTLAPKSISQPAFSSSLQIAIQKSVIYGLTGINSNAGSQYIQIHDASSAPADGAAPSFNIQVPAGATFSIDFGIRGMYFNSGIYVCNSSTPQTKTIGAADCQFFARMDAV